VLYRVFIFSYDALQTGFGETQNGFLKIHLDEAYVQTISWFLEAPFMLVFLAFTFQLFYNYRKKIKQYFSNTYQLELNWILTFLIIFSVIFIYDTIQDFLGQFFIELNYFQRWWLNLLMALCTLYVGIMGFFTDTSKLNKLSFSFSPKQDAIPGNENSEVLMTIPEKDLEIVRQLMEDDKIYLNPNLNLQDFADQAGMSRAQLSETINSGFKQNFNDFVNSYRVKAFKDKLKAQKHLQLSLLGVAEECGFNSKATFNRVFRKFTNTTPTQYANGL
jgi:AraC-like DNA-binding protein